MILQIVKNASVRCQSQIISSENHGHIDVFLLDVLLYASVDTHFSCRLHTPCVYRNFDADKDYPYYLRHVYMYIFATHHPYQ